MGYPPVQYLPNLGRNISAEEPPNIDHLYSDPKDQALELLLRVDDTDPSKNIPIPDRHWSLVWQVGTTDDDVPVHRVLSIVRERSADGPNFHLTNWGPLTRTLIAHPDVLYVKVASLNYEDRKKLEDLAENEPVAVPNGWWNCQHWVASVLSKAVEERVVSREDAEVALKQAGWEGSL